MQNKTNNIKIDSENLFLSYKEKTKQCYFSNNKTLKINISNKT